MTGEGAGMGAAFWAWLLTAPLTRQAVLSSLTCRVIIPSVH